VAWDTKKWTSTVQATIREGYLYGRGSMDDKAMLAANLAIMVAFKRTSARLARDVFSLPRMTKSKAGQPHKFVIEKYWGQNCLRLLA